MTSRSAFDAKTLERRYYVGQDVYEQETERIFFGRWLFVGRASQIADPGAYMLFEVESESVIVLRDYDGSIHAHHNVCRHRGTLHGIDQSRTARPDCRQRLSCC